MTRGPAVSFHQREAADDSFIARLASQAFDEYAVHPAGSTLRMARSGVTWVACRDETPLGFVVVRPGSAGPAHAELCAIAVDEHARGVGVGGALLAKVERVLSLAGVTEITIHTAQANVAALELFLKHGFRVERRLPRFYRGVFDACALRKRIGGSASRPRP
ncbi:MAG: GNAT family N-acetyltransferase [Polyangiaceae bacterium]